MPPRIALATIGHGRDELLARTVASCYDRVWPPEAFALHVHVDDRALELGFAGAMQLCQDRLRTVRGAFDYVFHVEEDWQFDRAVDLEQMADALDQDDGLAQIVLRRGPVNHLELAAGGVVEMWPNEYESVSMHDHRGATMHWLEHRLYFSTNPGLYRAQLLDQYDWPLCDGSEAAYTQRLLRDGWRFALWGARDDGTWITHTGHKRTGTGY